MLLQEVDYRERNLRLAEMSIFTFAFERLLLLTADLIPYSDPKTNQEVKKDIHKELSTLLGKYEAELYQEKYLPEYQRAQRELSRREKEKAEAALRREKKAMALVEGFAEDTDKP